MFRVEADDGYTQFTLSSEMRLVDRMIQQCVDFAKQQGTAECPALKTVLRELMINAIEHGNKKDESKDVECRVDAIGNGRFQVVVRDQGEGFDTSAIRTQMGIDAGQERSRGYPLIFANSDQVTFNEAGTEITAYITESVETGFPVSEEDGVQVIRPTGDLTAATADPFRLLLLEQAQAGHNAIRFDMDAVHDMDSVSLSVFLSFVKMVRKQSPEAKIELVNVCREIAQLLRMTRLDVAFGLIITLKD